MAVVCLYLREICYVYAAIIAGAVRQLFICHNSIGYDGIFLIASELQRNNILTLLSVRGCGLAERGMCTMYYILII